MEEDSSKTLSPDQLPGFRFRPTEEELLNYYLKNVVLGKKQQLHFMGFLNIYLHDPCDLPGLAKNIGEREWYFLVPRERKPSNGGRPNRTTQHGFWKATGSDRKVFAMSDPKRVIGFKKTLVFYEGRAPRGTRTDWVMNEYRLQDNHPSNLPNKNKQDTTVVLCRVYRKATSLKMLEQWAAKEGEEHLTSTTQQLELQEHPASSYPPSSASFDRTTTTMASTADQSPITITTCPPEEEHMVIDQQQQPICQETDDDNSSTDQLKMWSTSSSTSLLLPLGSAGLPELQAPELDWPHDYLFGNSLLKSSPFFDILALFTPSPSCNNLLKF